MSGKKVAALQAEIAVLNRRIENLQAQDLTALSRARDELEAMARKCLKGSGVIVTIRYLSGDVALSPVMIVDGLGAATIECLGNDIRATHSYRVTMNPVKTVKMP